MHEAVCDIFEIKRAPGCHSDSECSVLSRDILNSTYPVKPRKWTLRPQTNRLPRSGHIDHVQSSDVVIKMTGDNFKYLLDIAKTHPELAAADKYRDIVGQKCEVSLSNQKNCNIVFTLNCRL